MIGNNVSTNISTMIKLLFNKIHHFKLKVNHKPLVPAKSGEQPVKFVVLRDMELCWAQGVNNKSPVAVSG